MGGEGGSAAAFGNGGNGGSGTASAKGFSRGGNASVSASATGGAGGVEDASFSGSGGSASATSNAVSDSGEASSSAYATGGVAPLGGEGGSATATANALATRGGRAISEAVATGGEQLNPFESVPGAANATSTAKSTFAGASVQSTDEAAVNVVTSSGTATASSGVATANAVAQAGGAGQVFVKPNNSAYAFSTVLPDKADAATLIGGASAVADAFLGPRDTVVGTAVLGINDFPDEPVESFTFSESSTFDFHYQGDLLLGLIDGGGEFSVIINGVQTCSVSPAWPSLALALFAAVVWWANTRGPWRRADRA
jgi:hypothetical protein